MLLTDTSVWVDHLRMGDAQLVQELHNNTICIHPFIIGEIALGSLKNRQEILSLLGNLPFSPIASDAEIRTMIEERKLYARGIGYVDCHLLASTILRPGNKIWTRDKRLASVAHDLGLLSSKG